jgi:hypothetical protein
MFDVPPYGVVLREAVMHSHQNTRMAGGSARVTGTCQ